MLIDLQLHSTYSDGYLKPEELVEFLKKNKIRVASMTDHNTIGGISIFRSACKRAGIKAINGMELYVKYRNSHFNILWYNFHDDNPHLHQLLRDTQMRRRARGRAVLKRLQSEGFKINPDRVIDKFTHYVPVNRLVDELLRSPENKRKIAKELENKNFRESEVISHYFCNKRFCTFSESYVNINRILNVRKEVGGQIIMCHPGKNMYHSEMWPDLKKMGVDGVEVLSPHHSINAVMHIQQKAYELDWIETGGSDFHRHEGGKYSLQNCYQWFHIDSENLRGVEKIIGA